MLQDWRDLAPAVHRLRHLLDLDADPVAIDATLSEDPVLAPLVAAAPGLRTAGSVDPFETAVRAIVGQQISIAGARTVAGRIVAASGAPLAIAGGPLTHVFPTPLALAEIDPVLLPMPASRRRTIVELARRVSDGRVVLDRGADRDAVATALLDVPGIGPWTTGYVLMRGLGDPDVFLSTDLGVTAGLARLGVGARTRRAVATVAVLRAAPALDGRRMIVRATVDTPIGRLTLIASEGGLREIRFPIEVATDAPEDGDDGVLEAARRQLGEYFDGSRRDFDAAAGPARHGLPARRMAGVAADPLRRRPSATANKPAGSATSARLAPSGTPTGATHSRSSCRATVSSAPMAA